MNLGAIALTNNSTRGAYRGSQVYTINQSDKQLYLSDDGSTFNAVGVPWMDGWVWDGKLAGGGSLWWASRELITNGTVPLRLYGRNGSVTNDMTGNFWTGIFPAKANVIIKGMCLTYKA
jgi:hypothetical protein